jgi:L-alanine-DL-glutamate epimerase-like enolase superfamily enzyme
MTAQLDEDTLTRELASHRIDRIRVSRVRTRYPRLYGKNSRLPEHSYGIDFLVEEVETDQGARGWAFDGGYAAPPVPNSETLAPIFKPFLGRRLSELFDPRTGIRDNAFRPLDFALHDLAGRILGLPAAALIGDPSHLRSAVECYDGAIYMNDISPDSRPGGLSAILADCAQDYDMGYRAFKIKSGRGGKWMSREDGLRRDIEVVRLVREHYPQSPLLVDGNDAFDLPSLLRFVDATADVGLYWIEEPFPENREGLLRLREHLAKVSPATLIADGEFKPDLDLLQQLAEERLVDVLLMDIHGFGLTRWRSLMPQVIEKGWLVSPHNWGAKLKTHYTTHLAAALGNFTMIEGVPDQTEGVDFDAYALVDGHLTVPSTPGFGMELIWGRTVAEWHSGS